jgi:hypothetical protein
MAEPFVDRQREQRRYDALQARLQSLGTAVAVIAVASWPEYRPK